MAKTLAQLRREIREAEAKQALLMKKEKALARRRALKRKLLRLRLAPTRRALKKTGAALRKVGRGTVVVAKAGRKVSRRYERELRKSLV